MRILLLGYNLRSLYSVFNKSPSGVRGKEMGSMVIWFFDFVSSSFYGKGIRFSPLSPTILPPADI